MSEGEETVLSAVREALEGLDSRAPLPDYGDEVAVSEARLEGGSLWEIFSSNLEAVGGRAMTRVEDLAALLVQWDCRRGYCDPKLKEEVGEPLERAGFALVYEYERENYNDYAFGVTRASGAIAESGTLILNDFDTSDRLAALSPWVHVAVLPGVGLIHRSIPAALAALGECPNVVWATGPSKTADVEGILIEGVHGPGEEICLCLEAGRR
ncbi:MAG: LUD domain-containing protein [Verrucomicrobiales bacterium]